MKHSPSHAPRPTEKHWLTIHDFRKKYSLGLTTTYHLLRQGKIARVKIGRMTRIPLASAEAWAASLEAGGEEA